MSAVVSPVLLNVADAAKYLGISQRKMYDLAEPRGPIPCYHLAKRITRFSINDLNAFINKCRYDTFETKSVSVSSSRPRLADSGSELQNSFRRLGIKPKQRSTTSANPRASTRKQADSNVLPISSKRR